MTLVSVCDRVEIYTCYAARGCQEYSVRSQQSQTDTKSTLTDTRSNSRETDSRKRTDISQATPTDRSPRTVLYRRYVVFQFELPPSMPPTNRSGRCDSTYCTYCAVQPYLYVRVYWKHHHQHPAAGRTTVLSGGF